MNIWGFDVMGDAVLGSDDMSPTPAPPASNGTPAEVFFDLPARPDTLPGMPEPASLGLVACGSLTLLGRRRRRRKTGRSDIPD